MVTRKNAKNLTPDEVKAFVAAVKALKSGGKYDQYFQWHAIATATTNAQSGASVNGAHRGPAFLAWHRAFLYAFEKDLQNVSLTPSMAIPYWDWTTDPTGSTVFTPDLMGGNGDPKADYAVTDGPFARGSWTTVYYDLTGNSLKDDGPLRRFFGAMGKIPDKTVVQQVMYGSTVYDAYPWNWAANPSFRADIENKLHDPIHVWVGGHMTSPMLSPNDPVFYLHHANIDRLWARWQGLYPSATYVPQSGLPAGQNLDDQLLALTQAPAEARTPAQVWDYRALGYEYDREPQLYLMSGVNSVAKEVDSSKQETEIAVSVPPAPAGSAGLLGGLSGWGFSFIGGDHHLRGAEMLLAPPPESLPPQISFTAVFGDDDKNRKHSIEASASLLFITKEITS